MNKLKGKKGMEEKDEDLIEAQYKSMKKKKNKEKRGKILSATGKFFGTKIGMVVLLVLIVGGVGLGIKTFYFDNNKATELGFKDIGELATQQATCAIVKTTGGSKDLFGVEIPFTQTKYIYSYDVNIKAGLDFGDITWDANNADKQIVVYLPKTRVLSSELDTKSFKVYHEQDSVFTYITLDKRNKDLESLKTEAEKTSIKNGLLTKATSNAKTILKSFFAKEYNLKTWKIVFKNK